MQTRQVYAFLTFLAFCWLFFLLQCRQCESRKSKNALFLGTWQWSCECSVPSERFKPLSLSLSICMFCVWFCRLPLPPFTTFSAGEWASKYCRIFLCAHLHHSISFGGWSIHHSFVTVLRVLLPFLLTIVPNPMNTVLTLLVWILSFVVNQVLETQFHCGTDVQWTWTILK